jgi:hypothetical protein
MPTPNSRSQNKSFHLFVLLTTSLSLSSCSFSLFTSVSGLGSSSKESPSSVPSSSSSVESSSPSTSSSSSLSEWTKEAFDSDVYFQSDMKNVWSDYSKDDLGYWGLFGKTYKETFGDVNKYNDQYFLNFDATPAMALNPDPVRTDWDLYHWFKGGWKACPCNSENYWVLLIDGTIMEGSSLAQGNIGVRMIDDYVMESRRFAKGLGQSIAARSEYTSGELDTYPDGTPAVSINRIDLHAPGTLAEWSDQMVDESESKVRDYNMALDWTDKDVYQKVKLTKDKVQLFCLKKTDGWTDANARHWKLTDYMSGNESIVASMELYCPRLAYQVKKSNVYKALPENQKVYDLPNVIETIKGDYVTSKIVMPESIGRTLPWDYDGTV